jgi:hypothetical protein
MEEAGQYGWIAFCANDAFARNKRLKDFSVSALGRHVDDMIRLKRDTPLCVLWLCTDSTDARRSIITGLLGNGLSDAVKGLMNTLAKEKKWESIMNWTHGLFGNEPGLRSHSISLLEKNVKAIIRSGASDVVEFLSGSAMSESTLRTIERMSKNTHQAAQQGAESRPETPKAVQEDKKAAGCAGRMEKLFAAWQRADQDDEKRYLIMNVLLKDGSDKDVIDFLGMIAGEKQMVWVRRLSKFLYDQPELQSYANSLLEKEKTAAHKPDAASGAKNQRPGLFADLLSDIRKLGSVFQS